MKVVGFLPGYSFLLGILKWVKKMEEVEWDVELLYKWATVDKKPISEKQEDEFLARVRVLVIDQKKSNSEARRTAYKEII